MLLPLRLTGPGRVPGEWRKLGRMLIFASGVNPDGAAACGNVVVEATFAARAERRLPDELQVRSLRE